MSKPLDRLGVTFLFRMIGSAAVGERIKIAGPLGGRYMTTATDAGTFEGPRLKGEMLAGFAWSPHRMPAGGGHGFMQYDVKLLLRTHDGHRILIRYRGVNSPAYADGSWRTAPVFEAEVGPYDWLNGVQAIAVGRIVGADVEYDVYAVD
jgi:hypothetical protein